MFAMRVCILHVFHCQTIQKVLLAYASRIKTDFDSQTSHHQVVSSRH